MNNVFHKHVSAILVTVMLLLFPVYSSAFNEYDKVLHFSVSAVFGAASETYLHYNTKLGTPPRIIYSTFLGIVPGIFKELYDDRQGDNSFDWGDMAANTGGAFVGAMISNYVNNKIQISVDSKAKTARIGYRLDF